MLDGYIITTSIFVAGMLSDLFTCLSERLTIVNLMTVFSGNPQPLQSLWAPLQHFVNAYVLRSDPPTVENIDRAVTRILDDMRDDLHATCVSLSRIRPASLLSWHIIVVKGAMYRIWCGVNRLGDCGVKVVWIDSAIIQLLLSRLVIYCYPGGVRPVCIPSA